jgi:hypothetical protein
MPEIYKSFGTILGTTAATTIYSGLCSGTAIVNSINISNTNPNTIVSATVELLKGSTAFSIITSAAIPGKASLQVLDAPLVVETNNTLRATAGATGSLHTIVSILEIT